MSPFDIVRAWKDAEYRRTLSPEQRAQIPAHPAGLIELADADLDQVSGGLMASNPSKTCCVSHHCG